MAHNYNDIIEIKSKTHKIKWTIFNGFFHQVDGISEEKATECLQLREEGPHSVGYNTRVLHWQSIAKKEMSQYYQQVT